MFGSNGFAYLGNYSDPKISLGLHATCVFTEKEMIKGHQLEPQRQSMVIRSFAYVETILEVNIRRSVKLYLWSWYEHKEKKEMFWLQKYLPSFDSFEYFQWKPFNFITHDQEITSILYIKKGFYVLVHMTKQVLSLVLFHYSQLTTWVVNSFRVNTIAPRSIVPNINRVRNDYLHQDTNMYSSPLPYRFEDSGALSCVFNVHSDIDFDPLIDGSK